MLVLQTTLHYVVSYQLANTNRRAAWRRVGDGIVNVLNLLASDKVFGEHACSYSYNSHLVCYHYYAR